MLSGYNPPVPATADLPARFAAHWQRQRWLAPGARLAVAVSGGSDSVALLLLLQRQARRHGLQLGVAHLHHGLRAEAGGDAAFVSQLAAGLRLPLWLCRSQRLSPGMPNLEAAARQLRYRFFCRLLSGKPALAAAVATGHTLDDQAETVLLRLLRGAGTLGLCGIWPTVRAGAGKILRPLLPFSRAELQDWLCSQGQAWREDTTNRDLHHRRNRLRHQLLPLLARDYNPEVHRRLAGLATVLQAEEEAWAQITAGDGKLLAPGSGSGIRAPGPGAVRCAATGALAVLPLARLRRLLRALAARPGGAPPDFAHVDAVATAIQAAAGPAPPSRPRHFRLGSTVLQITPRWVWVQREEGPARVILKP